MQEWFEREYVFGAINPFLELLQRWVHMILHEEAQSSLKVEFFSLPHLEITRVNSLLRSPSLDRMFYVLANVVYQSVRWTLRSHSLPFAGNAWPASRLGRSKIRNRMVYPACSNRATFETLAGING